MITLVQLRSLEVSAASGLCFVPGRDGCADHWVVIADDRPDVLLFGEAPDSESRLISLLDDAPWPEAPAVRKAHKADFEAICALPDGSFFIVGSGSSPARKRGVLWRSSEPPLSFDLAPLYDALAASHGDLNIEGVAVAGDLLCLLSRRIGTAGKNLLISLDLPALQAALAMGVELTSRLILRVVDVALPDLPELLGVPLGFTDACSDDGPSGLTNGGATRGLWFSAAAEATDDPIADGHCTGSVIGQLDQAGNVQSLFWVDPVCKIEGLFVSTQNSVRSVWAVFDADDPTQRSALLKGVIPAGIGLINMR